MRAMALVAVGLVSIALPLGRADDDAIDQSTAFVREILIPNRGDVPFPFTKISKPIGDQKPLSVVIPDGRSLQRKKADFSDPRVLTSYGDLFIGYAPRANQLEVISWNSKKEQYDFFVVQNYGPGLKPKVALPDRATCTACHQGEAPIFSRFPWGEVGFGGNDGKETVLDRLRKTHPGQEDILGAMLVAKQAGDEIAPGFFNDLVRDANARLQVHRMCADVCHGNVKCQEMLVGVALLRFRASEGFKKKLQNTLSADWPNDGYAYVTSVLPSRDPLAQSSIGGTVDRVIIEKPSIGNNFLKTGTDFTLDEIATATLPTDIDASVRKSTYQLGGFGDPTVPRPKSGGLTAEQAVSQLSTLGSDCFNLTDFDMQILDKYSSDQIANAVSSQAMENLLGRNPKPDRAQLMRTILGALGATEIPQCFSPAESESRPISTETSFKIEKVVDSLAPQARIREQRTALFGQYCARCHSDDNIAKLPLDDLNGLRSAKWKNSILEKLTSMDMPPPRAKVPRPSIDERIKMILLLDPSQNPQTLRKELK